MSEQQPTHLVQPVVLVVITDSDRVKRVKEILSDSLLRFMFTVSATGTANSELLDVLGLGSVEKAFITSLMPSFRASEVMQRAAIGLSVDNPGGGVVFTVPLSGMGGLISRLFDEGHLRKLIETLEPAKREHVTKMLELASEKELLQRKQALERIEGKMEHELEKPNEFTHDLILSVINLGYSDELMDAAREAGARGGTVIHARRTGAEETVKFFGISLQAEKEVVAILTERKNRNGIMKAISQQCGITTEAAGIVFSVPVDSVAGLSGL